MLKTLIASKAVRLAASCVCPVVGTGVLTMAVPSVRHAVHNVTAPRQYALPKTRVRPAVAAPCPGAVPVDVPAVALAPDLYPAPVPGAAAPIGEIASASTPVGSLPIVPVFTGPGGDLGGPPTGPGFPTALPDGRTWLQLTLGFGLVGGAARIAQAKVARA